jgi:ubiquinone/menaquinone biosynthesis C-methylase UbiE
MLQYFEAEIVPGIELLALAELRRIADDIDHVGTGQVRFRFSGSLSALAAPRMITTIYALGSFAEPRPRALLGHANLHHIVDACRQVCAAWPAATFTTLRLSAAGEQSVVMRRLRDELAGHLGLAATDGDGDLLVRLRRSDGCDGWDVLIRLTPRPLASRAWRRCSRPGALAAPLAAAMMELSAPAPADVIVNLCCGSATLLVERGARAPWRAAWGIDLDADALACADENLTAAGMRARVQLAAHDVRALPFDDAFASVVCVDLPYGRLVGSHHDNLQLYPALIAEAARIAQPRARMVLVTHEIRLLEQTLQRAAGWWHVRQWLRVRVGGMTPVVGVLERTDHRA